MKELTKESIEITCKMSHLGRTKRQLKSRLGSMVASKCSNNNNNLFFFFCNCCMNLIKIKSVSVNNVQVLFVTD